jgi:arylformamidase
LKTDNSEWIRRGPIPQAPAYLAEDGAQYLVERGVRLVGFDGLSVDHPERSAAHLVLLKAGVVILEAIDLSGTAPGDYELLCLPLPVVGGDGAPARAVLRAEGADGGRHAAEG